MLDQSFNGGINLLLGWEDGSLTYIYVCRAGWQVLDRLRDELQALDHLRHANQVAVVNIATSRATDIEFEIGISKVRLVLAQITSNPARTSHRPRAAPVNCVRLRQ